MELFFVIYINDDISDLEYYTYRSVTIYSTYRTSNWYVYSYGNIRILSINSIKNIPAGGTTSIGEVSDEDTPRGSAGVKVYGTNGSKWYGIAIGSITPSKVITIYNYSTVQSNAEAISGQIVYIH